jgi:hypothetical protein
MHNPELSSRYGQGCSTHEAPAEMVDFLCHQFVPAG